jgi:DNA-directed RNA polymerase specialized sigma24 family protein
MLRYVEGHDVGAIAVIRNSSVGTVTKQLSRAHRRLEKMIVEGERR